MHWRHSKGTWALGHSGTQGTWAVGHLRPSGTRRALRHLSTRGTWALGYSGTWALRHSKGSQTLGYSGTWGTLFSRLLPFTVEFSSDTNGKSIISYFVFSNVKQYIQYSHVLAEALSSLFFDPETHPEDTLKVFLKFTEMFIFRYNSQFPEPPKVSLELAIQRWKIHHTTIDTPKPKLELEQCGQIRDES